MSVPDPAPPRKPRRLWLYLPYILLLGALIVWTGLWFAARRGAETRIAAYAQTLRAGGVEVDWDQADYGGYPFRLNVTLSGLRIRDPGGWGVSAPKLEAQAYMHGLDVWVLAAPEGASLHRPLSGDLQVRGELLRASLAGLSKPLARFSLEGRDLTFTPSPGARPFALSGAGSLAIHLRPGPDDQAAILLKLEKGRARPGGLMAIAAPGKPVDLSLELIASHASAFRGPGIGAAGRAWRRAGGDLEVRQLGLSAGDLSVGAEGQGLGTDAEGRLQGRLQLSLRNADPLLPALAQTGLAAPEAAAAAQLVLQARQGVSQAGAPDLVFQAGRTTLGPVALGPSPRLY